MTNSRRLPSIARLTVDGDKYYKVWGQNVTLFFDARNVLDATNISTLSTGGFPNPYVNTAGDDYQRGVLRSASYGGGSAWQFSNFPVIAADVSDPNCVYAEGGSGAGGNVYAIVGKFPDFFSAAVVHSGMSDYLAQYQRDETGEDAITRAVPGALGSHVPLDASPHDHVKIL